MKRSFERESEIRMEFMMLHGEAPSWEYVRDIAYNGEEPEDEWGDDEEDEE